MEIELSEPQATLSDAVRQARTAARMTQEKMAQKAGLSVRTVRLIEQGECDPREGTIRAICNALEIPPIVLRCMATPDDERERISKLLDVYYKCRSRR